MELVRLHSRGGFSVRSFIAFCLAVLAAVLFLATISASPAQAQPAAATWQNESTLLYDGHAYQSAPSDISQSHGLAEGTVIFTYTEPAGQSATATRGAYFIYFAPGTDPPTATSAEYVRYTLSGTTFSNPQDQATIVITPFGEESERSSCEVSGGLGWIICPVTIFLANTMDSLFDLVANFLAVKPLTLDPSTDNSLYNVWNVMRNIANIAFVIAFLIIIYTQITSMGVSSYGMKKMVPRLVIAAVLVNASFIISAAAIDLSNILGFSIQDIFISIRENTFYMTDESTAGNQVFNSQWTQWATIILGGAGVVGGVVYAVASGAIFFLLPLLASLALTLFVVLIVLAARQAIIVVLVIIAPLAFVANLLPNTEKWFGKWRDLFMTMLIFFPAFSLIFGGSQLAGQVIIQNAGDDIIMILFGMAVQVAPLVVTPLIFKLSGNLLGKIAQIANNPNKGLVDRTRNFSKGMSEQQRQKTLGKKMEGRTKLNLGARMVQSGEKRRRLREDRTSAYKAEGDNRYHEDKRYSKVYDATEAANLDKESIHNEHQAHFEKQRNTPPAAGTRQRRNYESIYDRSLRAEAAKDMLAEQQANTAGHYDTLRTVGGTPLNASRNQAEAAKSNAEAAAQNLSAYQSERRTFKSTEMGKAAINLETAKLNAEGQQSKFTAHIDGLKIKEGTTLHSAAQFAQSSKEHAETAQHSVQTMFDHQRKTQGTALNISSTALQDAQIKMDEAKSLTTQYFTEQKSKADGVLHIQNAKTEAAKIQLQNSEAALKSVIDEYRATEKRTPEEIARMPEAERELAGIVEQIRAGQEAVSVQARRSANAGQLLNERFANSMIQDSSLRQQAGGIRGDEGANGAMANAISVMRKASADSVSEAEQIFKYFNPSAKERQAFALGESFNAEKDGVTYTFSADNDYMREAAIEEQMTIGTVAEVIELVKRSGEGGDLQNFRTTIGDALPKNAAAKSIFLGGRTIADVKQGLILGDDGISTAILNTIGGGKTSSQNISTLDAKAAEYFLKTAQEIQRGDIPDGYDQYELPELREEAASLSKAARQALSGDERANVTSAALPHLMNLARLTQPDFVDPRADD